MLPAAGRKRKAAQPSEGSSNASISGTGAACTGVPVTVQLPRVWRRPRPHQRRCTTTGLSDLKKSPAQNHSRPERAMTSAPQQPQLSVPQSRAQAGGTSSGGRWDMSPPPPPPESEYSLRLLESQVRVMPLLVAERCPNCILVVADYGFLCVHSELHGPQVQKEWRSVAPHLLTPPVSMTTATFLPLLCAIFRPCDSIFLHRIY